MPRVIDQAKSRATGTADAARRSRPALDHLVRGFSRYKDDNGDRLSASVTLPGFLAFFPLVALAFSVLGFVVHGDVGAQHDVIRSIGKYLPGLLCQSGDPTYPCTGKQIDITSIGNARAGAGVIGLVGLLLAGLGWVDALRNALRVLWHQDPKVGNFLVAKARDIGVLAGLGVGLLASLAVAGMASSATTRVLDILGAGHGGAAQLVVKVVGILVSIGVDLALFQFLFTRLSRSDKPRWQVLRGAAFAAVGFELLQLVGATYVKHVTSNPVYGSFAVVIGLLIWINVVVRFTLFAAAWTVTAPYDSDVAPSETASEADSSADPGPRRGVVGKRQRAGEHVHGENGRDADRHRERVVRRAGRLGVGLMLLLTVGIALHGGRTLRDVVLQPD